MSVQTQVPAQHVFNGKDFLEWEFPVKTRLRSLNCITALTEDDPSKLSDGVKNKAMEAIIGMLDNRILGMVLSCTYPFEVMEKLRARYAPKNISVSVGLRTRLSKVHEGQFETMEDYVNEVSTLVHLLRAQDGNISKSEHIHYLKNGLAENCLEAHSTIRAALQSGAVYVEEIESIILEEKIVPKAEKVVAESKIAEAEPSSGPMRAAMVAATVPPVKGPICYRFQGSGHLAKYCTKYGEDRPKCNKCGKYGHEEAKCKSAEKEAEKGKPTLLSFYKAC